MKTGDTCSPFFPSYVWLFVTCNSIRVRLREEDSRNKMTKGRREKDKKKAENRIKAPDVIMARSDEGEKGSAEEEKKKKETESNRMLDTDGERRRDEEEDALKETAFRRGMSPSSSSSSSSSASNRRRADEKNRATRRVKRNELFHF